MRCSIASRTWRPPSGTNRATKRDCGIRNRTTPAATRMLETASAAWRPRRRTRRTRTRPHHPPRRIAPPRRPAARILPAIGTRSATRRTRKTARPCTWFTRCAFSGMSSRRCPRASRRQAGITPGTGTKRSASGPGLHSRQRTRAPSSCSRRHHRASSSPCRWPPSASTATWGAPRRA